MGYQLSNLVGEVSGEEKKTELRTSQKLTEM